jgi:hypothetical protein
LTDRRIGVLEVEPASVPEATRLAAAETLIAVARDLNLPSLCLRWFALAPGVAWRPDANDIALASLGAMPDPELFGHANSDVTPPVVWVRFDLPPHVAAVITAHEARHVWQRLIWNPDDDARFDQAEEDADAYALGAPWPERYRLDIAWEPMLDAGRARAKALRVT